MAETIIKIAVSDFVKKGTFAQSYTTDGNEYCIGFVTPVDLAPGDICRVVKETGELVEVIKADDNPARL